MKKLPYVYREVLKNAVCIVAPPRKDVKSAWMNGSRQYIKFPLKKMLQIVAITKIATEIPKHNSNFLDTFKMKSVIVE